jgi:hypothetical protein
MHRAVCSGHEMAETALEVLGVTVPAPTPLLRGWAIHNGADEPVFGRGSPGAVPVPERPSPNVSPPPSGYMMLWRARDLPSANFPFHSSARREVTLGTTVDRGHPVLSPRGAAQPRPPLQALLGALQRARFLLCCHSHCQGRLLVLGSPNIPAPAALDLLSACLAQPGGSGLLTSCCECGHVQTLDCFGDVGGAPLEVAVGRATCPRLLGTHVLQESSECRVRGVWVCMHVRVCVRPLPICQPFTLPACLPPSFPPSLLLGDVCPLWPSCPV